MLDIRLSQVATASLLAATINFLIVSTALAQQQQSAVYFAPNQLPSTEVEQQQQQSSSIELDDDNLNYRAEQNSRWMNQHQQVKNNYKTGANTSQYNNATSQSSNLASISSASSSSSSLPSAAASAQNPQNPVILPNRPLPPSRASQQLHYQTTYACEGNQLDFGCQEGKMIHLVRAIYGRFSLSICNEQGYSNYSVDCASFKAFLLMETRCNKLNNCSVNVSEELFGDPCQGTSKYLEVQYYCYDANNNHHNNNNQLQQQQQVPIHHRTNQHVVPSHLSNFASQQQPTSNNNNYPAAANPLLTNDIAHKSPQLPPATNILGQPKFISSSSVGGSNNNDGQQRQPVAATTTTTMSDEFSSYSADQAAATVITGRSQFCSPQTSARNLHWNYTRAGRLAKQNCPEGSLGEVSWLCDAERLRFLPQWSPDFSKCRLSWLERLSQQLDRMLESPGKQQQSAPEMTRSQNEQILKLVLTDLTLMVRTKELFSEDLARIDIMISQILAQFRSLSVVFGSLDSWRSPVLQGGARNNNFAFLYEDLFKKLISITSSLFDASQRSAWLEIKQSSERQRLEQRFLAHLKEAGILMASVFGSSLANYQLEPIRQPNVFAGFAVINNNGNLEFSSTSSSLDSSPNSLVTNEDNNELQIQLRQTQSANLNSRFSSQPDAETQQQDEQTVLNELRVHSSVLRELTAKGVTRLLVIDVRKPNYALTKQQLESAYATTSTNQEADLGSWLSVLDGSQLWTTRVFGVFAIVGENGDVFDGQQQQQHRAIHDLLAQWPISVDFRSSSLQVAPLQVSSTAAAYQQQQQQPQVARSCSALDLTSGSGTYSIGMEEFDQQPCKTYKVNATSHICRCSRFGFVALISYATQQQQQLPTNPVVGQDISQQWPATSTNQLADEQASYVGAPGKLGQQQQSVGTWTAIFIALGLFLLIGFVGAFLISAFIRVSSQSRLNKKPGFFGAAGFGHRDLNSGPTTGPLVDHSLVSGGDSLVGSAGNNGTTQSGSIIGLTQSAYQGYKTHQQSALYAAHLHPMAAGIGCQRNRWLQWTQLLNPSCWLGSSRGPKDADQMIQHRIIGSSLGSKTPAGSVSYKSTYQNGYTTAGLHHPSMINATGNNNLPIAAPSSSTSSYVSSSAYYEEIGPGNLTKVNTNQLNNPQRTPQTLVDPFKRSPIDHHQQVMAGQQATLWIQQQPPPNSTGIASYQLDQPSYGVHQQQQQQQVSMMPVSGFQASKQIQNNDLSQLQQQQQQSVGGGSQHSGSGSTPRHYLFASPTAVNAYKNSMSQQQQQATTLNHHHHCQQMQFKTNQDHHRFMPN